MSTNGSIKGWANHVDGAIALTKLRGEEQFKNPTSRAVFRAVRTLMVFIPSYRVHWECTNTVNVDYKVCSVGKATG